MVGILPAAGRGTRMNSVSPGSKELLAVGGKPVLQRVIDEAVESGVDRVVAVLSPSKPDLLEFAALQDRLESVIQKSATGLAPATVLAAGLEPVLLLLPDTIFFPASPSSRLDRK